MRRLYLRLNHESRFPKGYKDYCKYYTNKKRKNVKINSLLIRNSGKLVFYYRFVDIKNQG